MGGSRVPGPMCTTQGNTIDEGTMCRSRSPNPGPLGTTIRPASAPSATTDVLISPVYRDIVQISNNMAAPMTWDAWWRKVYEVSDKKLQAQANSLLQRGNITNVEFEHMVTARNTLVEEFRKPLSPFGKQYSEFLKPMSKLPQPADLLAKKGSVEAVLESVGKSRASVNRLSMVYRVVGTPLLVLDITITTIVVMKAPKEQRGRTAAREYTGLGVGVASGAGGAWAGCVSLAALGSPSLVVPIVGEVTEGTLCTVGGILGGLGVGWLGREAGKAGGEAVYDYVTTFRWE